MNVACGACPAKYVIPDEKVRGRKVRIPCKRCGAAIIIDGTSATPENAGSPSDEQVSPDASTKSSLVPNRLVKAKSTAATGSGTPGAPPPTSNAFPAAPQQAVRPQRTIRQTIIGVAAPANAPESNQPRPPPIRRPTPIYVRSPVATTQSAPIPPEQSPVTTTGKIRSLRRTMVGGLDSEEPAADSSKTDLKIGSKSVAPPVASPIAKPGNRDVKHTVIGGLEAAIGSAPGAEDPRRRSIPRQDTPPGTWMAILPDGKTLRITEGELPRALSKGYVTGETLFWRTGLQGWVPLNQVPELSQILNRTSARPQPKGQVASSQIKSASSAPTVPKTRPSQAAPVPSFSRPPTAARLAVPSTSTAKHADSGGGRVISSVSAQSETSPFTTSAAKVSRGPASVSARSSSPTLELVELDNDDDVARLISSDSDERSSNSNGIHELQRLAASAISASQKPSSRNSSQGSVSPAITDSRYSRAPSTIGNTTGNLSPSNNIDSAREVYPQDQPASLHAQPLIETAPTVVRRKASRTLKIELIIVLSLACLVTSLVTRQPRPFYNYLHARGWDQTLDLIKKKAIELRKLLGR